MNQEYSSDLEVSLQHNAFDQGNTNEKDTHQALIFMNNYLKQPCESTVNETTIDTTANRKSEMCRKKYEGYGSKFGRRVPIIKPQRGLKGKIVTTKVILEATAHIRSIA